MGYKILGFLVWRGAKFYLGRRFGSLWPKVAIGGATAAVVVVVGALAAGRNQAHE